MDIPLELDLLPARPHSPSSGVCTVFSSKGGLLRTRRSGGMADSGGCLPKLERKADVTASGSTVPKPSAALGEGILAAR